MAVSRGPGRAVCVTTRARESRTSARLACVAEHVSAWNLHNLLNINGLFRSTGSRLQIGLQVAPGEPISFSMGLLPPAR